MTPEDLFCAGAALLIIAAGVCVMLRLIQGPSNVHSLTHWHKWFAWHPVVLSDGGGWVWWREVDRRYWFDGSSLAGDYGGIWRTDYREPHK